MERSKLNTEDLATLIDILDAAEELSELCSQLAGSMTEPDTILGRILEVESIIRRTAPAFYLHENDDVLDNEWEKKAYAILDDRNRDSLERAEKLMEDTL